ncbi:MAG TPA: S26 family signal peptidase, partial [Magnetospirillaceae bacterium]|nr:S26 family signal peptidase [Magnetospirillaceae bacterium]
SPAVPSRRYRIIRMPTLLGTRRLPSGGGALLAAILLAQAIRVFLVDLAVVEGYSMEPFASRGSVVLVIRWAYGIRTPGPEGVYRTSWGNPAAGDTVLAYTPGTGRMVVKRVASVLDGCGVGSWEARAPAVYLLGDNPAFSRDSREYGPVRRDRIAGRVILLLR